MKDGERMLGIGYRTIKTAIGAGLAVWISTIFQLEFATFSAIIAILCIEKTKKKTWISIKDKLIASLLALILGAIIFEVIAYHPIVLTIFILLFIPILVHLKLTPGLVTSIVVVLHVYSVQEASIHMFLNELFIILIGMGIALSVNSFMPSYQEDIESYKRQIEAHFQKILHEYSACLQDHERKWAGKELFEVERMIQKAKSYVLQDIENHFFKRKHKDYDYLEMRENQLELLKHMLEIVAVISQSELHIEQKEILANFLKDLSKNVNYGHTVEESQDKLKNLKETMRKTDLPKTREEFEIRANLFYLIFEMENFLNIKRKLFQKIS